MMDFLNIALIILLVILIIIFFVLLVLTLSNTKEDESSNEKLDIKREAFKDEQNNSFLKKDDKYQALFKREEEKALMLYEENTRLIKNKEKVENKLKKSNNFLMMISQNLSNNSVETRYINNSNLSPETMLILQLDYLIHKDITDYSSVVNKVMQLQDIFENQTNIDESKLLQALEVLGREIIETFIKYGLNYETVSEQLNEVSDILYASSRGKYEFIVPRVGSDFLNNTMEAQFSNIRSGEKIKSIENWGIKVGSRLIYKARVKC